MGILSRIKRITVGRIETFLSSVEDPEVVFPQLISEMEDQIRLATDTEAKALAAVRAAERALEQAKEKLGKMSAGAESALKQDDESMAREAIAAEIGIEQDIARKEEALAVAKASYEDAHAAREEAQEQLDELRSKKDEILTRSRVAASQEQIQKTVSGPATSTGSILDAVSRLESQLEEKEAELAVRKSLDSGSSAAPSLERRIDEMNATSAVDERLAALKAKLSK